MTLVRDWMSSTKLLVAQGLNYRSHRIDWASLCLFAIGVVCVVLPLELGQISFSIVGAIVYALIQSMRKYTKENVTSRLDKKAKFAQLDSHSQRRSPHAARDRSDATGPSFLREPKIPKPDFRKPSVRPVLAPTFHGVSFETQVGELLKTITPTSQGDKVMKEVAFAAKRALYNLLPGADVVAYASADFTRGRAFGVAVPEVDIILNASPNVLAVRLQTRTSRPLPHAASLDALKLQKAALRACTDELVAAGVFKFRRSAFKGMEPKVTLLAAGFNGEAIPVDFSVNTVTPLYNAALLTECGQRSSCARDLILLVRRWAKDRGVSHAAKCHLSPYAWTILVLYFLQVRDEDDSTLRNLQCIAMSLGDQIECPQPPLVKGHTVEAGTDSMASARVASLFREFFHFYTGRFDFRNELISVRSGSRQPPHSKFPLHVVLLEDGGSQVAPSIEDPFEPKRNLASLMSAHSLTRLREELSRAVKFCLEGASLGDLLEPWKPPERGSVHGVARNEGPSSEDGA